MTTPTPAPAAPADFPGKTLGIVGLILAIVASFVGLIISVIANNQSKAAGFPNQPAKIGIIVGIITTILTVLWIIVGVVVPLVVLSSVPTS